VVAALNTTSDIILFGLGLDFGWFLASSPIAYSLCLGKYSGNVLMEVRARLNRAACPGTLCHSSDKPGSLLELRPDVFQRRKYSV